MAAAIAEFRPGTEYDPAAGLYRLVDGTHLMCCRYGHGDDALVTVETYLGAEQVTCNPLFTAYTPEEIKASSVAVGDTGTLYGFAYQPQRFSTPDRPISGVTTYPPFIRPQPGERWKAPEPYPWFASRQDAVRYIKQAGFYGQVIRYTRGPDGQPSWITAGVTDTVNAPSSGPVFGTPLGMSKKLVIHRRPATVS